MSCLAIYRPGDHVTEEAPATIPFPKIYKVGKRCDHNRALDKTVERAKLVYANRCCRDCGSVAVVPLELNDSLLNASLQPIPGSATIVGFRCNSCFHEWPAKE